MREKLIELCEKALNYDGTGREIRFTGGDVTPCLIADGVTVQEWISVKDRLPIEQAKAHEQEWCEEYCEFLVMIDRGFLPTTLYYDWEENEWFRINTALERETYKVTHWMPLPEPPKGK
jgi:hypothetical protein